MSSVIFKCPSCGADITSNPSPLPTVDMLIYDQHKGIVLVNRKFPPLGWALPGGFVDYGESVETAAIREAKEETSLTVSINGLVGVYSDPARDKRKHTISTVFWGTALNPEQVKGADDAKIARFFSLGALPEPIVFDHLKIIDDFVKLLKTLQK